MKLRALIWQMMWYRPWLYVLNGLIWMVIHLAPIVPGLLTREVFDTFKNESASALGIWGLLALLIGSGCGRVMFIFVGALTDVHHRFFMSGLIRRNVFAHMLKRSGTFGLGNMMIQFREDAIQAEDAISWTLDVIGRCLFAGCSLAILLTIAPKLTLLVFVPLIAVVAVANMAAKRLSRYRQKSKAAAADVAGFIGEMAALPQAIQLAQAENQVVARLEKLNQKRQQTTVKDRVSIESLNAIFTNTVTIGTGALLLLSASAMTNGTFTVGDFALFIFYLGYVTEFTQFFGCFLAHYRQTKVSFQRMAARFEDKQAKALVRHVPLHVTTPLPPFVPPTQKWDAEPLQCLRVENLTHQFPGSKQGIRGASFTVEKGRLTVITGRVGAGKTTLLRTLLGQLLKQAGEIYWNDQRIVEPARFFTPPQSAYIPQAPTLFSGSLKDNILLGKDVQEVDLTAVIHQAVLSQDIARLRDGVDTIVGVGGVKLSGGQVQRVAIARMLACQADLLVLDDVSSALDVQTEARLWQRLKNDRARAYVAVSHRKACLRQADHIIVMKAGRIVAEGTQTALLESCAEFRALWEEREQEN